MERTRLRGSARRAKPYREKGAWRRERDDAEAQIAVRIGASGHPLNDEGINTFSLVTIEAMTICKIVMISQHVAFIVEIFVIGLMRRHLDVHFETVSIGEGRDLSSWLTLCSSKDRQEPHRARVVIVPFLLRVTH